MNALVRYSALQGIIASMEDDLGLSGLNQVEKGIIAALSNPVVSDSGVSVRYLLESSLLKNTSMASLYRALRQLKAFDYIEVVGDRKTGNYRMVDS